MEQQSIEVSKAQESKPASGSCDHISNSVENQQNVTSMDQIKDDEETNDRIKNFVWAKFNLDDIRELELRPVGADEDSEDEYDQMNSKGIVQYKKIDELYDIIKVVGAGGFGIVIACRDRSSNKKFALKIAARYHAHAASSLRREREMLAQMSHQNIIRVYEMRREYKNLVIMKMELGKETVTSLVERHQRKTGQAGLPEEQCAKIMKGLFRALAYLHDEQNVIHRDIKPDNIILGSHKDLTRVKLVDFGLAVQDSLDKITDFAKCGTFLYKPPEQVTNIFAYAKKADVWASGIIMFYMLTGRHPIWKEGINKLQMEQIMKNFTELKLPDSISPQAKHLISCLCQKNKSARYRAANALQHPWITRNLEQEVPLSDLDRRALAIQNQPIEEKLRKAMRVLMVCAISKQQQGNSILLQANKQQLQQDSESTDKSQKVDQLQPNLQQQDRQFQQNPVLNRSASSRLAGGGSSSGGVTASMATTTATMKNQEDKTTQQSSGSSLRTTLNNATKQQLENYKQMIMTKKQGASGASSPCEKDIKQQSQQQLITVNSINDTECGQSSHSGGKPIEQSHLCRKSSHNVLGCGSQRLAKANRDCTPKSHQRNRGPKKRLGLHQNQQPLLSSQQAPQDSQQDQQSLQQKESQHFSEKDSEKPALQNSRKLMQAKTDDRLHLSCQTKIRGATANKAQPQQVPKKGRPPLNQKSIQNSIKLPAKLSLQQNSNNNNSQSCATSTLDQILSKQKKMKGKGKQDSSCSQASSKYNRVLVANDDHDVKEKKRKLSNSSQKSQKLPIKHHHGPLNHEQNHIFRLKLSPEAKKDIAVSNRSKQSFYSSRQFEHFSDDEVDEDEDLQLISAKVEQKSHQKTHDVLQASENLTVGKFDQTLASKKVPFNISRNSKKTKSTVACSGIMESKTMVEKPSAERGVIAVVADQIGRAANAAVAMAADFAVRTRKKHRREFKTQRNGVVVQMMAKLDKSQQPQADEENLEDAGEQTPPGGEKNFQNFSRQARVLCETDNRKLIKQRMNLNSAGSQHQNYFAAKYRGCTATKIHQQNHSRHHHAGLATTQQTSSIAQNQPPTPHEGLNPINCEFLVSDNDGAHLTQPPSIISSSAAATQARKQQKIMRREKFASLKKQHYQHKNLVMAGAASECYQPASMKLPGITPKPNKQLLEIAPEQLYSEKKKKSVVSVEPHHLASEQQSKKRQLILIGNPTAEHFSAATEKGITPRRNSQDKNSTTFNYKQIGKPNVLPADYDSQHSSTSQLSPCMAKGLFHQTLKKQSRVQQLHDQLSQVNPIRSTQAAGTAIVQGNAPAVAATSARKQHQFQQANSRGFSTKLPSKEYTNGSNPATNFQMLSEGTSQVLHGLMSQKKKQQEQQQQQQQQQAAQASANLVDKMGAGLLLLSQTSSVINNYNQQPLSTGKLLKQRSLAMGGQFELIDDDDELNELQMESPIPSTREYQPLLNKKLKQIGNHRSSENELAAAVQQHRRHYHRSIDKREKVKHKLRAPALDEDPDDLDLMDFDLPQPISQEKQKVNGSIGSIAQTRFLNNISANKSSTKHQQPQQPPLLQGTAKMGGGSHLSKKNSIKKQSLQHTYYQRANSDIFSPFSVQCFSLK